MDELGHPRDAVTYFVFTSASDLHVKYKLGRTLLAREGIRVSLLTTDVAPELREGWYEHHGSIGKDRIHRNPSQRKSSTMRWVGTFGTTIVVFGSNTSTAKQAADRMTEADALRAELIGRLDLRVVED